MIARHVLGVVVPFGAAAALTGCGSSTTSPSNGVFETATEDCVAKINAFRATLQLPAYTRWSTEESCAGQEAAADATADTAHSAFGTCTELAQNECPGWPAPAATMIDSCLSMMWAEGPGTDFTTHGHYINMSSTMYTMVACGFTTAADGSIWAAQDFQ